MLHLPNTVYADYKNKKIYKKTYLKIMVGSKSYFSKK